MITDFKTLVKPMPAAGTPYKWEMPSNIGRFSMQMRDASDWLLSTDDGGIAAGNYVTMRNDSVLNQSQLLLDTTNPKILYFQSADAGKFMEIIYFIESRRDL